MENLQNILAYEWNAWRGYLISYLVEPHCAADWDDEWAMLDAACEPTVNAVLFHNCLSHSAMFPRRRAEFEQKLAQRGIKVLNAGLADMRKRTLHTMLERAGLHCPRAARQGVGEQKLFVKTDLNHGGKAEHWLPAELQPMFSLQADCPIRAWDDYRLVRRDEIEPDWWDNPHLVIETYIGLDDSLYRIYCCGDALICVLAHSEGLIKKDYGHPADKWIYLSRQKMCEPGYTNANMPEDLVRQLVGFTTHYPFDYFCLDLVHDGRRHVIVDLNLTPYAGTPSSDAGWLVFLRRGLRDLTLGVP